MGVRAFPKVASLWSLVRLAWKEDQLCIQDLSSICRDNLQTQKRTPRMSATADRSRGLCFSYVGQQQFELARHLHQRTDAVQLAQGFLNTQLQAPTVANLGTEPSAPKGAIQNKKISIQPVSCDCRRQWQPEPRQKLSVSGG